MTRSKPIFSLSKSICSKLLSLFKKCLSNNIIVYNKDLDLIFITTSETTIVSLVLVLKNVLNTDKNFKFSIKYDDLKEYIRTSYNLIDFALTKNLLQLKSKRSESLKPSSRSMGLIDIEDGDIEYLEEIKDNESNFGIKFIVKPSELKIVTDNISKSVKKVKFSPYEEDNLKVLLLEDNNTNESEDYIEISKLEKNPECSNFNFTFDPKYLESLKIPDNDSQIFIDNVDPMVIKGDIFIENISANYCIIIAPYVENQDLNDNSDFEEFEELLKK